MLPPPSNTYLFDSNCSGRLKYYGGHLKQPNLIWKYQLRSYPPYAPESMPAFDMQGNIYFGAHDGCFYSLTPNGNLRWIFKTGAKIQSSPCIIDKIGVFVASGDGYFYSFSFNGNLRWVYEIGHNKKTQGLVKKTIERHMLKKKMYDPDRKKIRNCRIWASPKVCSNNSILISGLGIGLHAIDAEKGSLKWLFDLGGFQYNKANAALGENQNIYIPSHRRYLHCITADGVHKWCHDTKTSYDSWAGPSVDSKKATIYFPLSYREEKGIVFALDPNGNIRWKRKLPCALRGSVTICYDNYILVGGFNGVLYFLSKKNGDILHFIQLSNANRGLWTTASVDPNGTIFLTTKDTPTNGSVYSIDPSGKIIWRYKTGKALSIPVLDSQSRLYAGTWNGDFLCLQT